MFFILSKIAWWFIAPLNALILLQTLGLLLLLLRRRRTGTGLIVLSTLVLLGIGLFPVSALLLRPLEQAYSRPAQLPAHIDGILLLGGGESPLRSAAYGFANLSDDAERLPVFAALARRHPEAKWVFSGGSGALVNRAPIAEAEVAKLFFKEQGLDERRLIVEDASRNTHENALLSRALVKPKPGETWILVTSAVHMPRSVAVFERIGWKTIPYPVSYRALPSGMEPVEPDPVKHFRQLELAVREWLGIAAYRLTGKI